MSNERLPHLFVNSPSFFTTEHYKATPKPRAKSPLPDRNRSAHGTFVLEQLRKLRGENEANRGAAESGTPARISLEIRSEPEFVLQLDSLEERRKGIVVGGVKLEGDVQVATVSVPVGALTYFLKRVEEYLAAETAKGAPKNQTFIDRISEIRLATLQSFWTDAEDEFPAPASPIWWEVWLLRPGGLILWDSFRLLAESAGLKVRAQTIVFPDRVVGLAYGTAEGLNSSAELLDFVGEVRRAKEDPEDFLNLTPREQGEWIVALLTNVTPPPADAPAICLLDSGVVLNPLIRPAIGPNDFHRFDPNWPMADSPEAPVARKLTHGTMMAGVALYGRTLAEQLASSQPIALGHRLESARILPPRPADNERRLYGAITSQMVSRVEISEPNRRRSFCMAMTSPGRIHGEPSSWSGTVDQICAGVGDGGNPRLFFVSAGNTVPGERHGYPESSDTSSVQDPGQAWNAVTVGACTDCVVFDQSQYPNHSPVAMAGDLSAASTTSLIWDRTWPFKPDIVMEGGNHLREKGSNVLWDVDSMAMLTTDHATSGRLLTDFRDTSAATAQAARYAAILQAEYPALWPEAVRALIIHSAEWTPAMRGVFGTLKEHHGLRMRRYGYGLPDLDRALYSARDSLTLIAQKSIQPFAKIEGSNSTNDMGLHRLPWPREQLAELGPQSVTLRVTLSYFIEPKPGRREGFAKNRHRYQSHGLRFEVQRPTESLDDLRGRVNNAARIEDETFEAVGDTSGWELGPKLRTRGSVHSDWWTGTAADLASCSTIAVYPVSGWWRESAGNDWSKDARYALVVSIRTAATAVDLFSVTEVDLYAPVDAQIQSAEVVVEPGEIEVTIDE